ncbi:MAG: regulatory protein RecX, partial [Pseudomonadota bacterium]
NDIRFCAMNLLARREHLGAELQEKLRKRFGEDALDEIEATLQTLSAEGLQSDTRYLESYIRQRSARGYGPERLRQELRQKGVSADDLQVALDEADIDWSSLARGCRLKKFGAELPRDFKDKAKQLRYLQYRGFAGELASAAFDADTY